MITVSIDVWEDDESTRHEDVELKTMPSKGERITLDGKTYVVYYVADNYLRVGNGA